MSELVAQKSSLKMCDVKKNTAKFKNSFWWIQRLETNAIYTIH